MGRSREDLRVYQDTDMTKLLLVFLAVLAVAAITSARQLEQDSSLSEDLAFSRIARSPEADAKRKSRRPKSRASKRKNKSRRQKKRRTRKSKKRGGKRGKKQSKKGTKGRRGSKSRSSGRQINYEECAMKMKDFASRIKKAGNLDRQAIRINKFKDITSTKKGKKGDFNTTLATLTTALGGNKSAPACRQSGVNFTDQLETLDNCMTEIEASCTFEMDSNVTAEVTACQEAGRALFTEVDKCLKPSLALADACSCFGNLTNTNLDKVKSCNITAANSAVTSSKKKCTQGFSACKRAEAGVVDIVDQCKPERKCGGAASKEEAEQQLKILTPLSDALSNTGFADAMSDAGLNTGTGSDGVLSRRHVRQVTEDGAACLEILEDWKSFNKSASLAVPGVAADIDEKETTNTINTLNKINNRATLADDLQSCQTAARQSTAAIIQIRFYVFWCDWFQNSVVEVRITIIEATFNLSPATTTAAAANTTASAGETTAAAGETTAAAGETTAAAGETTAAAGETTAAAGETTAETTAAAGR